MKDTTVSFRHFLANISSGGDSYYTVSCFHVEGLHLGGHFYLLAAPLSHGGELYLVVYISGLGGTKLLKAGSISVSLMLLFHYTSPFITEPG